MKTIFAYQLRASLYQILLYSEITSILNIPLISTFFSLSDFFIFSPFWPFLFFLLIFSMQIVYKSRTLSRYLFTTFLYPIIINLNLFKHIDTNGKHPNRKLNRSINIFYPEGHISCTCRGAANQNHPSGGRGVMPSKGTWNICSLQGNTSEWRVIRLQPR